MKITCNMCKKELIDGGYWINGKNFCEDDCAGNYLDELVLNLIPSNLTPKDRIFSLLKRGGITPNEARILLSHHDKSNK